MGKAVGEITFNAKDILEAGLFCRLFFSSPVKQGAVVGRTDSGHTALDSEVNVILVFGTGIKDGAFIIVKVVTEVVGAGNIDSPPDNSISEPRGAGNGWSWAAPLLKRDQLRFWVGRR